MVVSTLLMVIGSVYSVLVLLKNATVRLGRPLMLSINRPANLEEDAGNHDPRGADK